MREFFTRVEDGSDVNIEIEMNAYGFSSDNPWLFSLFIKFTADDAQINGFEEFLDTKESLIIALEHQERAKYVGSRIVDGWSELYFYAKESKQLESIVTEILRGSSYIFESSVVKDAKWNFHHKNLAPSELELCHIESEKIIFLLQEEGDDLSVVRPVEHYVSFELPTQKNRFLNTLDLEGFVLKDEISSDEFEHGIALVKEHSVTSEVVREELRQLFEAIKKNQGYYEGWSTVLASQLEDNAH